MSNVEGRLHTHARKHACVRLEFFAGVARNFPSLGPAKRRYVDGSLEVFSRLCVPDSARNPYSSADRCYRQQCSDTVEQCAAKDDSQAQHSKSDFLSLLLPAACCTISGGLGDLQFCSGGSSLMNTIYMQTASGTSGNAVPVVCTCAQCACHARL